MAVTVAVMEAGGTPRILIRLVDDFSGTPLAGVRLTLIPFPVKTKGSETKDVAEATVTTGSDGAAAIDRAAFPTQQFRVRFDLPGCFVTGERFVPGPYTSDMVAAPLDRSVSLTIGLAPLVPVLPEDIADKAAAVLDKLELIRVGVDIGPNLGNQAAALLLLRNLQRLKYKGRVEVLADPNPTIEFFDLTGAAVLATPKGYDDAGCCRAVAHAIAAAVGLEPTRTTAVTTTDPLTLEIVFRDDVNGEDHYEKSFLEAVFTNLTTCSRFDAQIPVGTRYGWSRPIGSGLMDPARVLFTIRIESISEISVRDKIALLDPGYASNPLYGSRTTFVARPAFDDSLTGTPACLGLIGASERSFREADAYRREILKTRNLMLLQPYFWYPHLRCLCGEGRPPWPLPLPQEAAYLIDPIATKDFAGILGGLADKSLAAFLDAFVAATLGKAVSPITVYGIHQAPDPAVALRNILAGLAEAGVAAKKKSLPLPPAVALVISKVDVAAVAVQCGARAVALTDPEALAILQTGPGDGPTVVFHAPPTLPQPVFQILVQISRFPVILEGANSANLVQMLGKPYLSVKTRYTPYPEPAGYGATVAALNGLTDIVNDPALAGKPEDLEKLAGYFLDCGVYGTAFVNYFDAVRIRGHAHGLDEVMLALYCLGRFLD